MIYTITTFEIGVDNYDIEVPITRSRYVGYFSEHISAFRAVVNNIGDIYENGYYPWVVIEEVAPGIYPMYSRRWLFKWHKEMKAYLAVTDKLEWFTNTIGFGIG